MAGSKLGGLKTRDTNYKRHGKDFYKKIGSKGGKKGAKDGILKGFAANPELARKAGMIGGKKSKRSKSLAE